MEILIFSLSTLLVQELHLKTTFHHLIILRSITSHVRVGYQLATCFKISADPCEQGSLHDGTLLDCGRNQRARNIFIVPSVSKAAYCLYDT